MRFMRFIETDDKIKLNIKQILWVKVMNECLEVCMNSNDCNINKNTHKICKKVNPDSYKQLVIHWE